MVALLLTLGTWRFVEPHAYTFFVAAVMLAACYGGMGPAILATGSSVLLIDYFFLPPYFSLAVEPSELPGLGIFMLLCVMVSVLDQAHRRARQRSAARLASEQRAREAAESIQHRLHGLIDGLDAIVWERHPETFRFVFVNERARQVFGHPLERWLSEEDFWDGLIHEDEREHTTRHFRQALVKGDDYELEYRARAANGRELWVRDRMRVFRKDDKVQQIGGFMTEITERKRLEEERAWLLEREQRARRDAEAATQARDEFLASVSHELRTPLTSMLGWARLLRTGKVDATTTERALEAIDRNTRLQAQLVSDLLDVSRIVTGRLRLDPRPIELSSVIASAVEAVRPAAEAKAVALTTVLGGAVGPVSADPDRLQQVMWNLLSNAVKFTPKGGRVDVRGERVGSSVEIKVSDTGKGISAELLPHIFERFWQGDRPNVRSGLGLGLAIVRHLVELHGGTVRADSEGEGRGATFTVELPITVVVPSGVRDRGNVVAEASVGNGGLPSLENVRVLVVDDDADARELLEAILTRYGAAVTVVGSVDEALAAFRSDRPDVVVSDIGLPGEEGYGLIQKVRELGPERGGQVPAVALTAYARDEDRRRALAAGFQLHVAKPAEPQELAAAVSRLARLPKTA